MTLVSVACRCVFRCQLAGAASKAQLFVLSFMAQVIAEMNLLLSH